VEFPIRPSQRDLIFPQFSTRTKVGKRSAGGQASWTSTQTPEASPLRKALFRDETQRLHRLANVDGVSLRTMPHADREMRKDGITKVDVRTMCKRGFVSGIEMVGRQWRWTVEARDSDGRGITAVIEAEEDGYRLLVITAWSR